jgi:hypothetical protein
MYLQSELETPHTINPCLHDGWLKMTTAKDTGGSVLRIHFPPPYTKNDTGLVPKSNGSALTLRRLSFLTQKLQFHPY